MWRLTLLVLACVHFTSGENLKGRIVGGEPTDIENFPHQVSVKQNGYHVCGGSIFRADAVLTAAQCVKGAASSSLTIVAGTTQWTHGGTSVQVKIIYSHPSYNSLTAINDIAVLVLRSSLEFSNVIQPIGLPQLYEDIRTGTKVQLSGWGARRESGSIYVDLSFVTVTIVSMEDCEKSYGAGAIGSTRICADEPQGGMGACNGDYGGPMIDGGKLVGIISWGQGCGKQGYPGVYTKVSAYRSWIDLLDYI